MHESEEIKKYTTKDIQDEMLVLLKAFHKACVENDIKYSVHAGTMIGAVREKGFIEWDDDADVSFTRGEYNKFKNIVAEYFSDDVFYFSEYDNAFPQLWMKREDKPSVWVDFFIYDYITENKLRQKIKIFKIAALLGILKNRETMYLTKKRGTYKGVKYAIIYCGYLFGKLFSEERKRKMAENIRQGTAGNRKLIHRSNDRFIGIGFVYPKEVMSEYMNLPFEDSELMITTRYDDILIPSYGDYMTAVRDETAESEVHDSARETMPFHNKR